MAECPALRDCPFFNNKVSHTPTKTIILKKQYCLSEYTRCARFKVGSRLGRPYVPVDLFPDQSGRAEAILKSSEGET